MQQVVEKNLRFNLYGKVLERNKELIFEKEGQRYQLLNIVSEESDFSVQEWLPATATAESSLEQILAIVSRDSAVAYYRVKAGFIEDEGGLAKIPYDLKDKDEEDRDDEEEEELVPEEGI